MGFLTFLLQGIPVVGKLVDAFTNYTNKKMDTELEKYKVDGQVDLGAIQARAILAAQMKDDPATKFGRWLFILPTGVLYTLTILDSITSFHGHFSTLEIPQWMQYMPYAVVAYLFVTAWRGNYKGQ